MHSSSSSSFCITVDLADENPDISPLECNICEAKCVSEVVELVLSTILFDGRIVVE